MDLRARALSVRKVYAFGAVLLDEFPDRRLLGGAPLNFAYYLHLRGMPVELISAVGDDPAGAEILSAIRKIGMSTRWVAVDPEHPTGIVKVLLDASGAAKFQLMDDAAYDYVRHLPAEGTGLIYFGTGDQRKPVARATLLRFLDENRAEAVRFCDLNLRPPHFTPEIVDGSLKRTDVLKVSEEELWDATSLLGMKGKTENSRIHALFVRYDPKLLLLTRGEKGACAYEQGRRIGTYPAPRIDPIADSVGAGDAFCAIFLAELCAGKAVPEALATAVDFASEICRHPGAIVGPEVVARFFGRPR